MHTIGVLDPRHPRTKTARGQIKTTIAAMPDHRIFTPDADVLGRGAMLSGILCRIQGYQQDAHLRALHNCALFLPA
ncbi:DNA-binding protein, partial [Rhizobium ruizarguesonis]